MSQKRNRGGTFFARIRKKSARIEKKSDKIALHERAKSLFVDISTLKNRAGRLVFPELQLAADTGAATSERLSAERGVASLRFKRQPLLSGLLADGGGHGFAEGGILRLGIRSDVGIALLGQLADLLLNL